MPKLSPSTYIPTQISHSQTEIQLFFDNTSQQLLTVYKDKVPPDMILKFNNKSWYVHVYVIEQHSDLFWKGLVKKCGEFYVFEVTVDQLLSTDNQRSLFQKVTQCLYGQKVNIKRCEVQIAYNICKSLHLTELLDIFHTDILINYEHYDIFPLLNFANRQKIIDVITMCYQLLKIEHFQQVRYSKSGLLLCQPDLFRNILKRHNFLKFQRGAENFGLGAWQIKSLIDEYCHFNGIKGRRKERFFQEIQNRNPLTNSVSSQTKINLSPMKKIYTCTKMISMTSMKEITQPEEEEQTRQEQRTRNRTKISKCVSFASQKPYRKSLRLMSIQNFSPQKVKTPKNKTHINSISDDSGQEQKQSVSECSLSAQQKTPHNKNKNTLNTSSLSFLISDPKTILIINNLSSSLHTSLKSSTQTQKKASSLVQSLKISLKKSRQQTSRIQSMQSELDEIWAQIKTGKERLRQVQRVVNDIQERKNRQVQLEKKKKMKRYSKCIKTSIELDLTVSTEFGARHVRRPY